MWVNSGEMEVLSTFQLQARGINFGDLSLDGIVAGLRLSSEWSCPTPRMLAALVYGVVAARTEARLREGLL